MKRRKARKQAPAGANKREGLGLPENIRVVHSTETNPNDG